MRGLRLTARPAARRLLLVPVACLLGASATTAAVASATSSRALKTVRYHAYVITVPRSWPVIDLARHPNACVRFNRHAVYLGDPGAQERCPAHAAGRTEAVLLQPASAHAAKAGPAGASSGPSSSPAILPGDGSSGWLLNRSRGVFITASWAGQPELITRALGLRSLAVLRKSRPRFSSASGQMIARPAAGARRGTGAAPGGVYTGRGFDACSTPSTGQMSAWSSSPYRAIGVYIGGANMSCSQPNLTPGWVTRESAAGWHMIAIYVGRQAPGACGCSSISPAGAARQGRFAARDAVNRAEAIGMGPGNPLYLDMEGYTRTSTNTSAVLTFLAAWTRQVHALGYLSGVYSSGDSGIVDLVSRVGTGYLEPDDLWIARWNAAENTQDPNVPGAYWPHHERLHQDDGDHNETYHRVTINIDGDYVDGATAAAGTARGSSSPPKATSTPTVSGTPVVGQALTLWHATWSGVPTSYTEQWEDCDHAGNNCVPISGATRQRYVLTASDLGHKVRVVEAASNRYGQALVSTSSAATAQVLNPVPLYWLFNKYGNILPSPGTAFYGSPYHSGFQGNTIVGAATTMDRKGYWAVSSTGSVYRYGDAHAFRPIDHSRPIAGIAGAHTGYWLFTAYGNVYGTRGTRWYGSPYSSGYRGSSIVGMATTPDRRGYWLVDSTGVIYAYGDATAAPMNHLRPIKGIVAAPGGGYWLYTASGNVYPTPGTHWYGSPSRAGVEDTSITGMAATPDRRGYWLVDSVGIVYAFGDAPQLSTPAGGRSIAGMFR